MAKQGAKQGNRSDHLQDGAFEHEQPMAAPVSQETMMSQQDRQAGYGSYSQQVPSAQHVSPHTHMSAAWAPPTQPRGYGMAGPGYMYGPPQPELHVSPAWGAVPSWGFIPPPSGYGMPAPGPTYGGAYAYPYPPQHMLTSWAPAPRGPSMARPGYCEVPPPSPHQQPDWASMSIAQPKPTYPPSRMGAASAFQSSPAPVKEVQEEGKSSAGDERVSHQVQQDQVAASLPLPPSPSPSKGAGFRGKKPAPLSAEMSSREEEPATLARDLVRSVSILGHRGVGATSRDRGHIADEGGGALPHFPENSMAAFREAIRQGADGIEFDIFLSRDGRAMVTHDDELDTIAAGGNRDTGRQLKRDARKFRSPEQVSKRFPECLGRVQDNTAQELQHPRYSLGDHPVTGEAQYIPTFRQLLEYVNGVSQAREAEGKPHLVLNVELKGYRSGRTTAREIRQACRDFSHISAEDFVMLSFKHRELDEARRDLAGTQVSSIMAIPTDALFPREHQGARFCVPNHVSVSQPNMERLREHFDLDALAARKAANKGKRRKDYPEELHDGMDTGAWDYRERLVQTLDGISQQYGRPLTLGVSLANWRFTEKEGADRAAIANVISMAARGFKMVVKTDEPLVCRDLLQQEAMAFYTASPSREEAVAVGPAPLRLPSNSSGDSLSDLVSPRSVYSPSPLTPCSNGKPGPLDEPSRLIRETSAGLVRSLSTASLLDRSGARRRTASAPPVPPGGRASSVSLARSNTVSSFGARRVASPSPATAGVARQRATSFTSRVEQNPPSRGSRWSEGATSFAAVLKAAEAQPSKGSHRE